MSENVLSYSVCPGLEVSESEWNDVSELFSSSYGLYSAHEPSGRGGRRIRLSSSYYRRSYASGDYKVAFCRDGESLVAEAIFRERETSRGRAAFVVQLVVDERYRRRGIAGTLLHAIWGFSDFCCWGIVTSNAFTVESLESATFRRVRPQMMLDNADFVKKEVLSGIAFIDCGKWKVSSRESVIDSGFFTDRSSSRDATSSVESRLGTLPEGSEWLAIVFREQQIDDLKAYKSIVYSSSRFVAEAYARRMPQHRQAWARKAEIEIAAILRSIPDLALSSRIADFGAGTGRHVAALRKAGFTDLTAIDFASSAPGILREDVRTWRSERPFDLVLCLYDVIGSFLEDKDNKAVLASVAENLKIGGYAVVSVSNYGYIAGKGADVVDLDDPESAARRLFALRPSRMMETTGEYYNPNFMLVDEKRRVVCRKEQFSEGAGLPGEYLVCDRRFTAEEIRSWAEECGLCVLESRYVRAGFDADFDAGSGKEILLLARRRSGNVQR